MYKRLGWLSCVAMSWLVPGSVMGQSIWHASRGPSVNLAAADDDFDNGETYDVDMGAEIGFASLDHITYLAPTVAADIRLNLFQMAFRAPLRFHMTNWTLREQDWDEASDFFRLGQCVRIDWSNEGSFQRERGQCRPWRVVKDDYYVSTRLAPVQDFTLGHGTILNGFSNTLDPNHFQSALVTDFQLHEFVSGHFIVDNVTNPNLIGGTLSLQPFAYEQEATEQLYEESNRIHVQLTAASDVGAPQRVLTALGRPLTDGHDNLLYSQNPVTVVGADLQWRYILGDQINFELHADTNYILNHGAGTHAQALFIYKHPDGLWSWRGVGEFRYVARNYIPNYFDSYYFIQRQQFNLTAQSSAASEGVGDTIVTKQQYLDSLPRGEWDAGYYMALESEVYAGEGAERRVVANGRVYIADNVGRGNDGQFLVSLGLHRIGGNFDVTALYSRQNWNLLRDIFQLNNTLVKVLVRWDFSDSFYLLMNYGRIWQLFVDSGGSTVGYQSNNELTFSLGYSGDVN
ncbi:MAG: hypothetical protein IPK60_07965 [Sandaracinaceae bacterium]|nr:hypothetical protein [Sandaracinaceae bacterium]